MILDKYISYNRKVIIAVACAGLWIFFRTADCYVMVPRLHIFPAIFIMIWTYLCYYDPLFTPLGLAILVIYKEIVGNVSKITTCNAKV